MTSDSFAHQVEKFNHQVLGVDPRPIGLLNNEESDFSITCFVEEINELKLAQAEEDVVGCVDAIIDLMYFATGYLVRMGLTADTISKAQSAVHAANMEKKLGVKEGRGGSVKDAVKPNNWISPERRIKEIIESQ